MASPFDNGGTTAFPISLENCDSPDLSAACNNLYYADVDHPWPGEGGSAALSPSDCDCPDAIVLVNYLKLGGDDPLDGGSASLYPSPQTSGNPDGVIAAGFLYDFL